MKQMIPTTQAGYENARVIERPDGFYWQDRSDGREYGPFETLLEAEMDTPPGSSSDLGPGEAAEVDSEFDVTELGVADWIDEETGEIGWNSGPRSAAC